MELCKTNDFDSFSRIAFSLLKRLYSIATHSLNFRIVPTYPIKQVNSFAQSTIYYIAICIFSYTRFAHKVYTFGFMEKRKIMERRCTPIVRKRWTLLFILTTHWCSLYLTKTRTENGLARWRERFPRMRCEKLGALRRRVSHMLVDYEGNFRYVYFFINFSAKDIWYLLPNVWLVVNK